MRINYFMNNKIRFNKIVGTSDQIFVLYELLKDRTNNISHENMPNFYEHEKFVKNNPYKIWYLVLNDDRAIGTFYIKYDNSIGLKLSIQESLIVGLIIKYIKFNYKPEQAIASEVSSYFYFNVANTNKELIKILTELELQPIQISYKF